MSRIAWPLCYHVGTRAFGKGLLVDEELARAVRLESAVAVAHWWGVSRATVRKVAEGCRRGEKKQPRHPAADSRRGAKGIGIAGDHAMPMQRLSRGTRKQL